MKCKQCGAIMKLSSKAFKIYRCVNDDCGYLAKKTNKKLTIQQIIVIL
jgi:tRNA(Ile2) C34 agmatinyltransferase TiaS